MKTKEVYQFHLNLIKEDATSHHSELKPQKYYPKTLLKTFPLPLLDETVIKDVKETKIYDDKDIFVSPIVGIQKNDSVTGINNLSKVSSYRRFEKHDDVSNDKKNKRKEFDLLDTNDYLKMLDHGIEEVRKNDSASTAADEGFLYEEQDDEPVNDYEPIISEEIVEQTSDYEYLEESPRKEKTEEESIEVDEDMADAIEKHRMAVDTDEPLINKPVKQYKSKKYVAPPLSLLNKNSGEIAIDEAWAKEKQEIINKVFKEFNYGAKAIGYKVGPTVTLFFVDIEPGTDVNKINNFANTLQMRLKTKSLRIQSPIIGYDCAGVEIANEKRTVVLLGNLLDNKEFFNNPKKLQFPLGLNVNGEVTYANIEKMPHGLLAGRTGTGKSVSMNAMIVSLIYRNSPEELRFIMVDPKKVELIPYSEIPHLAMPVITDIKKAAAAFRWACEEMERRYLLFSQYRVKTIDDYNVMLRKNGQTIIPQIVIIIDELMYLMNEVGNEVESYMKSLGAQARAAGIHIIVATQRPSTDVIKGSMKNNLPTRIAFKVSSVTDSMTILDHGGAEKLLGDGDLLYSTDISEERVQGAYVSDDEIREIADFLSSHNTQNFLIDESTLNDRLVEFEAEGEEDELFEEIAHYCVRNHTASMNLIQQAFKISYNRINRILIQCENLGIVSSTSRGKSRDVVIESETELNNILNNR